MPRTIRVESISMTTLTSQPTSVPSAAASTVGTQLRRSPAVRAAIDAMVQELRAKSAQISDVRPPNAALKEEYESLMNRAAAVRGRPLLYPMLGSGVGNGALVELADGSVKWDMVCGIGVNFFGHSDPDLAQVAIEAGLDDVVKHGNLASNFEAYSFAETLLAEARKHSRLKHAYISTSGAMANENALKVCMQKSGGARVLAFKDCFMGRSITMLAVGDNHAGREGLPINTAVDYMPFYDAAAVERMGPGGKKRFIDMAVSHLDQYVTRYPGQHSCFIFELVQGEGGFNVGDRDYFKALMDYCKAHKIAIWDDEIQTFGRLPRMFAYEHFDLGEYVDVFCVGKMTQACVTLYSEEYNPKAGLLSGTFTGEGVSFRVGQRVLERLRDGDYYGENGLMSRHHAAFRMHAEALIAKHPAWFPAVPAAGDLVGGAGGMMRFTPFGGDKTKIMNACKALFEEGVILFYCGHGPYHMRLLPPLGVMKESDWPRVFECIERGMARSAS
jgi:4-aminobutyrate aminotransferase-like enzyme